MNVVAWGLVGDVGIVAESCRWMGTARYDIVGFFMMLKKLKRECSIFIRKPDDTNVEMKGYFSTFFINHTQHFGKGLRAAPHAYIDDGKMDIVVSKLPPRGESVAMFQQLPTGKSCAFN